MERGDAVAMATDAGHAMSPPRYSAARKVDAVRRVVEDGRSVGDVARELGVSQCSLFFWVRRYRQVPQSGAACPAPSIESLRNPQAASMRHRPTRTDACFPTHRNAGDPW